MMDVCVVCFLVERRGAKCSVVRVRNNQIQYMTVRQQCRRRCALHGTKDGVQHASELNRWWVIRGKPLGLVLPHVRGLEASALILGDRHVVVWLMQGRLQSRRRGELRRCIVGIALAILSARDVHSMAILWLEAHVHLEYPQVVERVGVRRHGHGNR